MIELYKFERTKAFELELNSNLIQTDLPNYAEIVFDFSEMAQNIYYDDYVIKNKQEDFGPWFGSIIQLSNLQINTRCTNKIAADQI